MKRLAKSPKTALRIGFGELGELGACARSASSSAVPAFALSLSWVSCLPDRCDLGPDLGLVRQRERRLEVCELLLEHRAGRS